MHQVTDIHIFFSYLNCLLYIPVSTQRYRPPIHLRWAHVVWVGQTNSVSALYPIAE